MGQIVKPRLRVLTGGQYRLEALHDNVMKLLDTKEKSGIRQLLKKNSESCKKLLIPFIGSDADKPSALAAMVSILEAHARECYTIGYMDCTLNRAPETHDDIV